MRKESSLTKARNHLLECAPQATGGKWDADLSFDETLAALGKSFAGTATVEGEPGFAWLFSHTKSIDLKQKTACITFIMSFEVDNVFSRRTKGLAFAKKDSIGGEIISAVLLREYDSAAMGWWYHVTQKFQELFLIIKLVCTGRIPDFFTESAYETERKRMLEKAEKVKDNLHSWHQEYGPIGPHWYVNAFFTNPDFQGQGMGSEVMQKVNEMADLQGINCYLEAAGKNRSFYERFGYQVVGQKEFDDPTDAEAAHLNLFFMVRMAS